ncbi:hypothetical protein M406DRAFT_108544 [Cryphonectria parasitica EP155]|uniref:Uncharacterized protein n=1 Tax=Cryphonectria parasitica (strain ATCC 38755 / EP155) TaxID=660469 RepID=A0A9P4XYI4_CRYP1|nr:uncharacterized protein M406DRAFT_108544 [Cryphonectria parasitica EP155]KAF3763253.1 hypothetical protein M406DRAFT_108544 [Cryphonectria parasitica EP155]
MKIMTRPSSRDKLVGKRIAVIGGTSGIGFGTACVLLEHGAHITIISSQQDHVNDAIHRLNASRHSTIDLSTPAPLLVRGYAGDVRDEAAFTTLLRAAAPFDHIIFTSVDGAIRGPLAAADLTDARHLFGVKFWGSVVVAKAIAAHDDIVVPGGSLTLTAGVVGLRASKGTAVGGALNGGLLSLTQGLALELVGRRVRVNTVVPGLCRTELWDKQGHSREVQQEVWAKGARELSVGFVGWPEDVAEAYLFLVRADYANGTTVVIDGGQHI